MLAGRFRPTNPHVMSFSTSLVEGKLRCREAARANLFRAIFPKHGEAQSVLHQSFQPPISLLVWETFFGYSTPISASWLDGMLRHPPAVHLEQLLK